MTVCGGKGREKLSVPYKQRAENGDDDDNHVVSAFRFGFGIGFDTIPPPPIVIISIPTESDPKSRRKDLLVYDLIAFLS